MCTSRVAPTAVPLPTRNSYVPTRLGGAPSWRGRRSTGATAPTRYVTTARMCTCSNNEVPKQASRRTSSCRRSSAALHHCRPASSMGRSGGCPTRSASRASKLCSTPSSRSRSSNGDGMTAPVTEKARTTRAALVDSASALFVEQGYGAVSVRDLARRTQVTSGAVYGHFRNKADLLVAAIAQHIAQDLYLPPNGRSGFRSYMQRQWRSYRSRAGLRALLVEGAAAARVDPDIRRQLNELQSATLDEWKAIYHQ